VAPIITKAEWLRLLLVACKRMLHSQYCFAPVQLHLTSLRAAVVETAWQPMSDEGMLRQLQTDMPDLAGFSVSVFLRR
jgi:hypothetical protein